MVEALMNWIAGLTDGERWAYGLGSTVIVAFVTHRFALSRERQTARRKAADDFRAAFHSALNDLYPLPANWPADIDTFLRGVFPSLQTAVAQFRPYIPLWKRGAFDLAWFRYRSATGRKVDIQCYHHYMDFKSPDEPPNDAKSAFRRNVATLIA